jgi:hypothetical protein
MADFEYIFGMSVPYERRGNTSIVAREERIGWVVLTKMRGGMAFGAIFFNPSYHRPTTIHAIGAIVILLVSPAFDTYHARFAARQGWLSARALHGRDNVE